MRPHNSHDDERFMAQFNQRLSLEPVPQWALRRQERPWLEVGWAFAAALLLGVYWSELRIGFFTLQALLTAQIPTVSVSWLCAAGAAVFALAVWLAPRLAREL